MDEFVLTSWRCLRTLTCLGENKRWGTSVLFLKMSSCKGHILSYRMQKVCSAAQNGLAQSGTYLCCNWLSLYMQLDGLAQVKREIRSASPRKDNINMQRVSCVMECRISVQMGKFPCVGAHNRSESTSSLAT